MRTLAISLTRVGAPDADLPLTGAWAGRSFISMRCVSRLRWLLVSETGVDDGRTPVIQLRVSESANTTKPLLQTEFANILMSVFM
jgi:hypothetical protein